MGGKKLPMHPPAVVDYAQDEDSWTTNNNGTNDESSLQEMLPPPITDGTYLNSALELLEDSGENWNITFNPGSPRPSASANRTFAPGPSTAYEDTPKSTSGKKRRREETSSQGQSSQGQDHYGNLKTIVMDPNIPFQAKIGAHQTIKKVINSKSGNINSLVDELFLVELGRFVVIPDE